MVPVAQRACVISCMPPVICRMLFLASCPLYIAGRAVPCRLSGTIVESLLTGLVPTAGCGCESGGASASCRCIRCASADFGETVLSPHAFAAKYVLGRTGFPIDRSIDCPRRSIALVGRSVGGIAARSAADGCECRAEVPRSTPRTHWELAHISRAQRAEICTQSDVTLSRSLRLALHQRLPLRRPNAAGHFAHL